jgi:three-Cys-motif partner protein
MTDDRFLDESTDQSRVKAEITSKYFWSWAKLIAPRAKNRGNRMAYVDLFSGPGRYKDGSMSTPLLVLRTALENPELHDRLITIFNDKDPETASALKREVESLEGISALKHQPRIICHEIGSEIVAQFEAMRMIPTLMLVTSCQVV